MSSSPSLGHVVFYVSNLQRSLEFYTHIIGLQHVANIFNDKAAVLTGGSTHHEILLIEVGEAPGPLQGKRIGLYHVGWKVGGSMEDLKKVYQRVIENDIKLDGMSDHTVSQSLYVRDPDNNEIELYIDNPKINWEDDKSWVDAPVKPLKF